MRKNSVKNTRINGEVQRVLAEIIRGEIKDPRISPWTSVVSVQVAPDLKSCKAWISVLGDETAREDTWQGLKSAEGFIRRQLARTINLRNTPEITFVMDQSIEYGVNMSRRIDEVMGTGAYEDFPGRDVPAREEHEAVFVNTETEGASADEKGRSECDGEWEEVADSKEE
ncbi:MAG: 30S ribosome-binding factor RbfA [Acetatifactor sp.]|nr:30S ribosome-binding factor RbfA [Acetatifactor sp.]MDE7351973.1 30S ribosome-binding factor RbfA [Acetatifactor sp.]